MSPPRPFPPPPVRPAEEECCGRGCDPCVFDYYDRALQRWRDKVEALDGDPDALLKKAAKNSRR